MAEHERTSLEGPLAPQPEPRLISIYNDDGREVRPLAECFTAAYGAPVVRLVLR
ncbi:MAG: hypothetical protein JOZ95_21490 [Solirubrobacterales bacterium]|nr:hypothetical protein [Solirubrobacterales bacterium]